MRIFLIYILNIIKIHIDFFQKLNIKNYIFKFLILMIILL